MRPLQWLGLLLWRGGLLFAGAAALWFGVRYVLRFLDVPPWIEVGGALLGAGFVFVMLSLVLERARDRRREEWDEP